MKNHCPKCGKHYMTCECLDECPRCHKESETFESWTFEDGETVKVCTECWEYLSENDVYKKDY